MVEYLAPILRFSSGMFFEYMSMRTDAVKALDHKVYLHFSRI